MNFEDSLEARFKDDFEAASLKLIEFLENEENLEHFFNYWNSLDQYQLGKEKSNSIYKRITAELSKFEETELGLKKEPSISFDQGTFRWRVA